MRSIGVTFSILLSLTALVMLGLGSLDLARLGQSKASETDQLRDNQQRLKTAESGMAYYFGSAVCGLGAFILTFAAYRTAARDRRTAERPLAEREARAREQAREMAERLAEEEARDEPPDPTTPVMTLDDLLRDLETGGPSELRIQAAQMIPDLAPSADHAGPPLMSILEDDEEDLPVLRAVALSLVKILGDPSSAVASVVRRLRHEDPRIRDWAAVTLGLIGPPAVTAVEALIGVLHDPRVGSTVAEALRRIDGPEARAALRGGHRV